MKAYLIIGATVFILNGLNLLTGTFAPPVAMVIVALVAGVMFSANKGQS